MECAITSFKTKARAGATLVEMMIAMAIASTLLLGVASLTIYTARSFGALANYVDLDRYTRNTLDLLVKEIRRADAIVSYSTNQLILTNIGSGVVLSYTYDPAGKTLVRTNGTNIQQLLKGCDAFSFAYFMDITISNSFDQYPATGTGNLRMVQLCWRCSRSIINKVDTESMQSAKVVIRR